MYATDVLVLGNAWPYSIFLRFCCCCLQENMLENGGEPKTIDMIDQVS